MPLKNKCVINTIGITGGIGSGKSRVCNYLAKICRLPIVDLDLICRQLLVQGAPGWLVLKEHLDGCFFGPSGELDRKAFRAALFAENSLRCQVNALLHPLARVEMVKQVSAVNGPVLIEIPLLFEAGWQKDVQKIVVVYADPLVRIKRIVDRDHIPEEQARQSVSIQHCLVEKAMNAHHVIDNSFSWPDTCLQLRHLADRFGLQG